MKIFENGWLRGLPLPVFVLGQVLLMALGASPARAFVCSEVRLMSASGVIGPVHSYTFSAKCSWSATETKKSFGIEGYTSTSKNYGITMDVIGNGAWNRKTGEASEKLKVKGSGAAKGESGNFTGVHYAEGNCNEDPFLKDPPGGKAVCQGMNVQYKGTSGPVFSLMIDPKAFLLAKKLSLVEAQALSSKKAAGASPPPPPPKPVAKQEPAKVSRAAPRGLAVKPSAQPVLPPQRPAAPVAGSSAAGTQKTAPTAGLPDITSAPSVMVGDRNIPWGGIVSINASEARRVQNGLCEFAIRHTAHNASATAVGAFSRRWTNSNVAGTWEMSYPSIPANGTVERVDTLPLKPGQNVLYLILDPGKAVAESNENNNLFRVAVDLGGVCGPASNSSAPGASSTPPKAGGRLKFPGSR